MRKKMGCLLALMALLSALTACGGDSAEDVSGTLPPETPMTPEETEFQSGRVEGGTYTNEFLSVACQLGDEWTYLTDEEIAQLNGEIGESLTDEELSEIPVYELMVCVKEGNYMGVITLASYLEDTTEEMAALFTALPQ